MKTKRKRTDVPAGLKHITGMDVKAVLRRRGIYLKQRTNQQLKAAALPLAKQLVEGKKKTETPQKYISFTDAQANEYWQKQIHNVERLEEHFDHAVRNFLVNHVMKKALSKLEDIVGTEKSVKKALKSITKDVFSDSEEEDLVAQAQIDLEPLLQNMGVIAGQDANKLIGINDPYIASAALRKKINDNVSKFAKSMIDTDQQKLADIIAHGIENGDSIAQIRSAVTDDFSSYTKSQAERITRTEVLRASTQSTLDAFTQSGVVQGQQWLTAGAIDECSAYDGKVETLDGSFYESDSEFLDGEPPLHPNCRCVLIPVLEDDSSS